MDLEEEPSPNSIKHPAKSPHHQPLTSKSKLLHQLQAYFITYFGLALMHTARQFWSMSKGQMLSYASKSPTAHFSFTGEEFSRFDTMNLTAYSIFIVLSGLLGDVFDLRWFVGLGQFGMALSYLFLAILGYTYSNSESLYQIAFLLNGTVSSACFPSFISVMSFWFPRNKRGFIIGLWTTAGGLGNIIGAYLPSVVLNEYSVDKEPNNDEDWWKLMAILVVAFFVMGAVTINYLVPEPQEVGVVVHEYQSDEIIEMENQEMDLQSQSEQNNSEFQEILPPNSNSISSRLFSLFLSTVTNINAFYYSIAFFFARLLSISFILWLPIFLLKAYDLPLNEIVNLILVYNIGGILGSIIIGKASDMLYSRRGPVLFLASFLLLIIMGFYTSYFMDLKFNSIVVTMFLIGAFVDSLNHQIVTSCAADIGKSQYVMHSKKMSASVTGFIDGVGSLGSAIGQLVLGITVELYRWKVGFLFVLLCSVVMMTLPLAKVAWEDFKEIRQLRRRS